MKIMVHPILFSAVATIGLAQPQIGRAAGTKPAAGVPRDFQWPRSHRLAWPEPARRCEADRRKEGSEPRAAASRFSEALDGRERRAGQRRHGPYATTDEEFGDIELLIEYKTVAKADSGIYLRGTPQVQIWDWNQVFDPKNPTRKPHLGSGGLFNNTPGTDGRDPLVLADRPFGEWNQFRIRQIGDRTWVWLNDKLVVDGAVMENFWDRSQPLPAKGPIMLQTHGGEIRWRNIFVRDIGAEEAKKIVHTAEAETTSQPLPGPDPARVVRQGAGCRLRARRQNVLRPAGKRAGDGRADGRGPAGARSWSLWRCAALHQEKRPPPSLQGRGRARLQRQELECFRSPSGCA